MMRLDNPIGETMVNHEGIKMEIIGFRDMRNIDVKFETGEVKKDVTYFSFTNGDITVDDSNPYEASVGESNINKQGKKMTIIERPNSQSCKVQFEDGTIRSTSYFGFKHGYVPHPDDFRPSRLLDRKGQKGVNTEGMEMEIIDYRSCLDMDVLLADGTVVRNVPYAKFKNGRIFPPQE